MLDQRIDDSFHSVLDQVPPVRPGNGTKSSVSAVSAQSMIGKSIVIKGEITGSESVHIEGTIEGLIALPDDRVQCLPGRPLRHRLEVIDRFPGLDLDEPLPREP